MFFGLLGLSLILLAARPAAAEDIPSYLAGMTGQLLGSVKGELKSPKGDAAHKAVIEKAYKALKQRSLHRFAGATLKTDANIKGLAEAIGNVKPDQMAKLKQALPALLAGGAAREQALKQFFAQTGRTYPSGDKRAALLKNIANAATAGTAALQKSYTIPLDDGTKINLEWSPDDDTFSVLVANTDDAKNAYSTEITGKTKTVLDADGHTLKTAVDGKTASVTAKDKYDFKKDVEAILGRWQDDKGNIWVIRKRGGALGGITLARLRGGKEGDEETYADARFLNGRLTASRHHDDVRDMSPQLPAKVKAQLANKFHPLVQVKLKLTRSKDGADSLTGMSRQLHVTYSRPDMKVESVHDPYDRPLTLTREKQEGPHSIGALSFDLKTWYTGRADVRERLQKYEDQLEYAMKQQFAKEKERDTFIARRDALLEQELKAHQKVDERQKALEELRVPKGGEGIAKRLVSLRRYLEDEQLQYEALAGLDKTSPDPKYKAEMARLEPVISFIKDQINRKAGALRRLRPSNADQLRVEINRGLQKAIGDTIRIPLELDRIALDIDLADARAKKYQAERESLQETVDALRTVDRKYGVEKFYIDRDGGLVESILVKADGKQIYSANREVIPYRKALDELDDKIDTLRKRKADAEHAFKDAQRTYVQESKVARDSLARVQNSIMTSAYGQSLVEAGFFFRDAIKNCRKGGPVYALGAAIYKRFEWTLLGSKAVSEVDQNAIAAQVEREIRSGIDRATASTSSLWDTIPSHVWGTVPSRSLKVAIKHSGAKNAIEIIAFKVGEIASLKKYLAEWAQKKHFEGLENYLKSRNRDTLRWYETLNLKKTTLDKVQTDLKALQKRIKAGTFAETKKLIRGGRVGYKLFLKRSTKILTDDQKFNQFVRRFELTQKAKAFGKTAAKDFGKGVAADTIKKYAKDFFKNIEVRAWYDYYHEDYIARQGRAFMIQARGYLWELSGALEALVAARKKFIESHDPNSGFKVFKDETFSDDASLTVTLYGRSGLTADVETMPADHIGIAIGSARGKLAGGARTFAAHAFDGQGRDLPLAVTYQK